MSKTVITDRLSYTVQEFATATGLGVTTIRDAIKAGHIIPSYAGSKPLITKREGERWLESLPAEKTS